MANSTDPAWKMPASRPPVVSQAEWQTAHEKHHQREDALTRERDALSAARRRLPWVPIDKDYVFEGPNGKVSLLDLFTGRRQLIIYRFFFEEGVKGWPDAGCVGCSFFTDNIGHLAHLNARDTTFVLASPAPQANIDRYKRRMGWEEIPWFTTRDDFSRDFGVDEWFGLNVFFRDGETIFHSYFHPAGRGVEIMSNVWGLLDITPLGRQEDWEDSPEGYPQEPFMFWGWRHDEYDT